MTQSVEFEIREMVDRETRAWDTRDIDSLMSLLHPDMVWPWPVDHQSMDPMQWTLELGRYNRERWSEGWQALFDDCTLERNDRTIRKIVTSAEGDAAFAVVDIDTLWRRSDGTFDHWLGRTCKIYSKVGGTWKMITHLGTFAAHER